MKNENKIYESVHSILNCYYCWYINQDSCQCDVFYPDIIENPRNKICDDFKLRAQGDVKAIDEFVKKALNIEEYKPSFSIEGVKKIAINAPDSWEKSLSQHEKDAVKLINELTPIELAEKVYKAFAEFLDPSLRRGEFDMIEYQKTSKDKCSVCSMRETGFLVCRECLKEQAKSEE